LDLEELSFPQHATRDPVFVRKLAGRDSKWNSFDDLKPARPAFRDELWVL